MSVNPFPPIIISLVFQIEILTPFNKKNISYLKKLYTIQVRYVWFSLTFKLQKS